MKFLILCKTVVMVLQHLTQTTIKSIKSEGLPSYMGNILQSMFFPPSKGKMRIIHLLLKK